MAKINKASSMMKIKKFFKNAVRGAEIIQIIFGFLISGICSVATYRGIETITTRTLDQAKISFQDGFFTAAHTDSILTLESYDSTTHEVNSVKVNWKCVLTSSQNKKGAKYAYMILAHWDKRDLSYIDKEEFNRLNQVAPVKNGKNYEINVGQRFSRDTFCYKKRVVFLELYNDKVSIIDNISNGPTDLAFQYLTNKKFQDYEEEWKDIASLEYKI